MKKKLFLILLMTVLVVGLIFSSCSTTAPAPSPAPSPSPSPATPKVEPIKLRFTHPIPPVSTHHKAIIQPWADTIKERTAAIGKPVEIAIFGAQSLGKLEDQYDMVVKGIADFCGIVGPEMYVGRFPLNEVMDLPFMFDSATTAALVAQELFDTQPAFRDEFHETKLLFFQPVSPKHINARTKQIKTLEDFKGLKANSVGGTNSRTLKQLGASPVTMIIPDVYASLERGLLDVGVLEWEGVSAFRWYEVTKYRSIFPKGLFISHLICAMNLDTFNKLPPEVQQIFEELSGRYMSELSGKIFDEENAKLFEDIMAYDKKVGNPEPYYVPEDEFQRWVEAANPLYDTWIADMEAKGLPGKLIFDEAKRLAEKYATK